MNQIINVWIPGKDGETRCFTTELWVFLHSFFMAQLQGAGGGAPAAPPGAWMPRLSGWSDEVRPSLGKIGTHRLPGTEFSIPFSTHRTWWKSASELWLCQSQSQPRATLSLIWNTKEVLVFIKIWLRHQGTMARATRRHSTILSSAIRKWRFCFHFWLQTVRI